MATSLSKTPNWEIAPKIIIKCLDSKVHTLLCNCTWERGKLHTNFCPLQRGTRDKTIWGRALRKLHTKHRITVGTFKIWFVELFIQRQNEREKKSRSNLVSKHLRPPCKKSKWLKSVSNRIWYGWKINRFFIKIAATKIEIFQLNFISFLHFIKRYRFQSVRRWVFVVVVYNQCNTLGKLKFLKAANKMDSW